MFIMKQPIHSIKMQTSRRCKINSIEQKRWAAYATAALASGFTLCVADSAEGEIHYSGLIHQEVPNGFCTYIYHSLYLSCTGGFLALPLGQNGLHIELSHWQTGTVYGTWWYYRGGSAYLRISAPGAAVRGVGSSVSRLLPGDLISAGQFGGGGFLAQYFPARGQFLAPGQGFVGFKFNTGAGEQYGWVRVRMNGYPGNSFGVVDYAFGDPGEAVKAGQKRSHSSPDLESLGGLALGAAGLLAWRRRRANQRAAA
jgi:MYXO-CTERM domain-containing protein